MKLAHENAMASFPAHSVVLLAQPPAIRYVMKEISMHVFKYFFANKNPGKGTDCLTSFWNELPLHE